MSQLAERLDELLDEVLQATPADRAARLGPRPADDGPLDLPLMEEFRVGAIALAWDGENDRVVIEAQEESEYPVEPLAEDVPRTGRAVLRVRHHPGGRAGVRPARAQIVAQGRPPCPLCGLPLDAGGHVCPRQNGYRAGHD